jgi:structure-specific endonuclease subunit SLX1
MDIELYIKDLCHEYSLDQYTYVVYVLRSESEPNLMYCGCTNNIRRRLRQHNGCIKGGGKYTSMARPWKLAALIPNLKDKSQALRVEYWSEDALAGAYEKRKL